MKRMYYNYSNGGMFGTKKKEVISLDIFTFSCNGCGQCVDKCRHNVLSMVDNGYCRYAVVQRIEGCTGCGKCERSCSRHAVKLITTDSVNFRD